MLADDVTVYVLRIDADELAEQGAKAGRVERRAGAENAAGRQTRRHGDPRRQVRHDVHRVRRDHQHGVRSMAQDLRHDRGEHLGVALEEMQTRTELYETLGLGAYEALDASIVKTVGDERHHRRR